MNLGGFFEFQFSSAFLFTGFLCYRFGILDLRRHGKRTVPLEEFGVVEAVGLICRGSSFFFLPLLFVDYPGFTFDYDLFCFVRVSCLSVVIIDQLEAFVNEMYLKPNNVGITRPLYFVMIFPLFISSDFCIDSVSL